ncbi:MAG TPA: MauE/DoxX family redox-associated membrane protein [Zeimonas sp.]|nr:MauE/DoxX family redox-associated membrane protein [Zeimonas sp.]
MPVFAVDPVLGHASAAALALVFIVGAWHKLADLDTFRLAVERYRLLAPSAARGAALALPMAEALAGLMLLLPASRTAGAALAAVVLGLVSTAVAVNLLRGHRDIDCGCGTPGTGQRLSWALVARNAALLAACVVAAAPEQARELVWLDAFTAVFAALALWTLYAAANELLADSQRLSSSRTQP